MKVVEAFPHGLREIENVWIPLSDGVRLAARIWLPEDAEEHPVPAILEYLPYRKRDLTRYRDENLHTYFAGHGYAALRVDIRGSGDSDGILTDEYTAAEIADAAEVLRWIAAQPWCTGAVGMMGISWGGFNSLQVAATAPPELKAIITLCAADDRYADDAHYMGGCLLNENLMWGSMLFQYNALPPDPDIVGERWREQWLERLEAAAPFAATWMRHQRRDAFWRHGSVCEDYAAIQCAVYAIGGWSDGYSNAIPRLMAGLTAPRKALIGPWSHAFPHDGFPGPTIGFLQEAVRWWDHWLKGRDTGMMNEPAFRVWMEEHVPPQNFYEERPGRWVAEDGWPSERIQPRVLFLNPAHLAPQAAEEQELTFSSPQVTGMMGGTWCGFGGVGDQPADQRPDDGLSLMFDSEPLAERMEVMGAPVVVLELAVNQPSALLAVRLNDVSPDGASSRVTYGLLNLTHREDHGAPTPLEPGKRYQVRVKLNDIAHAFPAGNQIRVALSTAYWPICWPTPEPVTVTLYTGASRLELPERPVRAHDPALRAFDLPEQGPSGSTRVLQSAAPRHTVERDVISGETIYTVAGDADELEGATMATIPAIGMDVGFRVFRELRIKDDDPLAARVTLRVRTVMRREGWHITVETQNVLTASHTAFRLECSLSAREQSEEVFRREWDEEIPRDLV